MYVHVYVYDSVCVCVCVSLSAVLYLVAGYTELQSSFILLMASVTHAAWPHRLVIL